MCTELCTEKKDILKLVLANREQKLLCNRLLSLKSMLMVRYSYSVGLSYS